MMDSPRMLAIAAALAGLAVPNVAAAPRASVAAAPLDQDASEVAGLEALRAQDLRVATIAFRLATAGVKLCDRRVPQVGLVLHDAAQYSPSLRPVAARHFGLGAGPSISAIVPGSPAALAGLRADDALIAVNGVAVTTADGGARRASFAGIARAMAALDAAFARGPAVLTMRRAERSFDAEIRPVEACPSEVQLIPSAKHDAAADGHYVQVTSAMVDYAARDDELAMVIAHELAHNILRHRARLDAQGVPSGLFSKFGKNAARIRATEIEADRVGLQLVALAGYDVEAAPAFWRRFGKDHGFGIFADATHPSWRKREAALRQMIDEIGAKAVR